MVQKIIRYVATNDRGYRIGQDHPNAKLSNLEVEALIRDRGPDDAPLMTYMELANKYGISKSCARYIVNGDRRCQWVARWKKTVILVEAQEQDEAKT